LHDIYPVEAEKQHLAGYMENLEQLGLLTIRPSESDQIYSFKETTVQETAYNLMLFAQRRHLHRAIAEWFERMFSEDLSSHYPALAHHWGLAEDARKAVDYLEKAGQQALEDGSYQEAQDFFNATLAFASQASMPGEESPYGGLS
jgi:predicted ATPase